MADLFELELHENDCVEDSEDDAIEVDALVGATNTLLIIFVVYFLFIFTFVYLDKLFYLV